ncbi:white collar 2 type of transcription factor [Umbelopsis sp. WA50703]
MNPYGYSSAPPGYAQFTAQHGNIFISTPESFTGQPPSFAPIQSGTLDTNGGISHQTNMDFTNALRHKNEYDMSQNQLLTSTSDMTAALMSAIDNHTGARANGRSLGSNTTSSNDFTKRKNWDQRIIEELTDFLHVLSPVGKILFASPSSVELVGYSPDELLGRSITDFLHAEDIDMFIREFNLAIHTRSEFKVYYRFRKKDDKFITFEVIGHPYFGGNGESDIPKCFFGIAQPYPTKAGSMLDSFLELKIENEKLRKQLKELQSQCGDERFAYNSSNDSSVSPVQNERISDSIYTNLIEPQQQSVQSQLAANELLGAGIELSDSNAVGLLSSMDYSSASSVQNNMAAHHLGRDHRSDESQQGNIMSSTALSPKVLHKQPDGVGITTVTPMASDDKDYKSKQRKKKKQRLVEDEHVCHECGCVESPEWRRGPNGPKTYVIMEEEVVESHIKVNCLC